MAACCRCRRLTLANAHLIAPTLDKVTSPSRLTASGAVAAGCTAVLDPGWDCNRKATDSQDPIRLRIDQMHLIEIGREHKRLSHFGWHGGIETRAHFVTLKPEVS